MSIEKLKMYMANYEGYFLDEDKINEFFDENFIFGNGGCDSIEMCKAMIELQKTGVKLFNKNTRKEINSKLHRTNNAITSFRGEYEFLSNFYAVPINYDGIIYPTLEHAYQACKTFNIEERLHISTLPTAKDAKKFGQKVVLRHDWDDVKIKIMFELLQIKFSNPILKEKLISTSDCELIEGNTWNDTFWGVCKGIGRNILGKLLMQVRDIIK